MTCGEFIKYIKPRLEEYGVKLLIRSRLKNSGWFSGTEKKMVVCADDPLFFQVLVHEYSHFIQWSEYPEIWKEGEGACWRFFSWVDGNDGIRKLNDCHYKVVKLEHHCENTAINLIDVLDLDINKSLYISCANSHLFYYNYIKKYRKMCEGAYGQDILKLMPAKLLSPNEYLDLDNLPVNAQKQFEKIFQN